jgi:hypothetical protein
MWQEERGKSQARLEAIEEQRNRVLQKINAIEVARERYNAGNADRVTQEMDQATQAKWTAYFNLETDELEM